MSIFDLEFQPVLRKQAAEQVKDIHSVSVTKMRSGKDDCGLDRPLSTAITIRRGIAKQAKYHAGMRVMVGTAESDKGLVVKIWPDEMRGYKLCSTNINRMNKGHETDIYLKSIKFSDIPEGVYFGDSIGVKDGEIYLLAGETK